MKIINNKIYTHIFNEMAVFLVEKSTIDVYFLFPDNETPKLKMTADNISQYVDRLEKAREIRRFDGGFFMCQELHGILVTASEDGVSINQKYNAHPECNFK